MFPPVTGLAVPNWQELGAQTVRLSKQPFSKCTTVDPDDGMAGTGIFLPLPTGHSPHRCFEKTCLIRPLTAAIRPFFAQVAFGGWSQLSKRSAKAVSVRPGQPHRAKHHNHPHLRASLARIVLLEEGVRGGLLKGVLHGFAY